MALDGISIQGSYHDINQDSFAYKILRKGFVIALSDGLGSRKNSKMGSRTLCESIVEVTEEMQESFDNFNNTFFVKCIHKRWLAKLQMYDVAECYATMLFLIAYENRILAARLGDGFIGIWFDDNLKTLFDQKTDYYANETDCLTENLLIEKIEFYEAKFSQLHGAIMCSDGVGIGNMTEQDLLGFTKDFLEGYCEMKQEDITKDIQGWLTKWPGTDDKTLAFFISERN